jgi:predicted phage-related endonuclease
MRLKLGLSPEQVERRKHYIGGSDAGKIMAGDWHDLWLEKTGQREPEDLSHILPVQLGSFTEEFNRFWYEQKTGRQVTHEQEHCIHPDFGFLRANLDGRTTLLSGVAAVWEGKHVGGFEPLDTVVARYMPQLHHNMICAGVEHAVLSVLIGTSKWEEVPVEFDWIYGGKLLEREREFWRHVVTKEPPHSVEPVASPSPPEKWRDVDFEGNNFWSEQAGIYLSTLPAKKKNATAEKELKALVEADVGCAWGHGIRITRAKNNALTIREEKSNGRA